MINAIGYIRVSTEEQSADDKYGIETRCGVDIPARRSLRRFS